MECAVVRTGTGEKEEEDAYSDILQLFFSWFFFLLLLFFLTLSLSFCFCLFFVQFFTLILSFYSLCLLQLLLLEVSFLLSFPLQVAFLPLPSSRLLLLPLLSSLPHLLHVSLHLHLSVCFLLQLVPPLSLLFLTLAFFLFFLRFVSSSLVWSSSSSSVTNIASSCSWSGCAEGEEEE